MKMDTNNDVVARRRANLHKVLAERFKGKQTLMVEEIGINAGELSGLLRNRFFGEKKARSLEVQLKLPTMWLDGLETTNDDEAIVAEFAWLYHHATSEGRIFLCKAIQAAKLAYATDRRTMAIPVLNDRRKN